MNCLILNNNLVTELSKTYYTPEFVTLEVYDYNSSVTSYSRCIRCNTLIGRPGFCDINCWEKYCMEVQNEF